MFHKLDSVIVNAAAKGIYTAFLAPLLGLSGVEYTRDFQNFSPRRLARNMLVPFG